MESSVEYIVSNPMPGQTEKNTTQNTRSRSLHTTHTIGDTKIEAIHIGIQSKTYGMYNTRGINTNSRTWMLSV